ncbi:MAG TPA: site-2 protease family protein [Chthoniobacteraceae bacterium]|jgi:Zn-dependent protease/predicted transcriptional regulator|nr:site-2 protease family protein [Chthoniobacteraceae bacterium]
MNGRSRFGLYLGRWFGIRFYLDYSWFLIAAIVTYELAVGIFPDNLPDLSRTTYFIMGGAAALVYFLSILLHELGHSLVSQRCGIPVPRITLLFIGGIAEISREPDTAAAELKIAAGGPLVSILLSILYGAASYFSFRMGWFPASLILQWLAEVNLILVVFNAIPGYPLDGGRILRAIIWSRTGNLRKATFITTRIGVGFSWVLIVLGVITLFEGAWTAFIFFLIGIFLKNAAESGYTNVLYHEVLGGVRVADIMTRDPVCIPDYTPLTLVVDEFILTKNHVAYPVVGDDRDFRGMLHVENLKALPREKWAWTTASQIASSNATIDASDSAESAMRRLLAAGEGRLAVLENGKVFGIITRHDVLRFIKIHSELG